MHDTHVSVVGNLAADPVYRELDSGTTVANFRIGSTPRRRDRVGAWSDGPKSWWEVSCFGGLADNAAASLRKGQRVLVTGRALVEQWQTTDDDGVVTRSGTTARVTADALGHDLSVGTAVFTRVVRSRELSLPTPPGAVGGQGGAGDDTGAGDDVEARDALAASMGESVDEHGELVPLPA